jgi:hypothetical protein
MPAVRCADIVHYEAKNFGSKAHKKSAGRKFAIGMFSADTQQVPQHQLSDFSVFCRIFPSIF